MPIGPQPRLPVAAGAAVDGHPRARPAHELQPHLRRGQRIYGGPSDADWRQAVRAHRPAQQGQTPLSAASRPDPGGLTAPGGSGRFCALRRGGRPMWAPYPLPLAPEPAASETPIPHAFWPSRPAAGKSAARGARMQRLLDQSAVACRARGAAFFWLLAGFPRGPMAPFPARPRGSRARRRAAPLLLQSPVVRLESYVTRAPARERGACRAFSSLFLMGIREVRAQKGR